MHIRLASVLFVGALCVFPWGGHVRATGAPAAPAQQPDATDSTSEATYQTVLRRYCVGCHNQRTLTAGLALDTADLASVGAHADLWEGVVRKLRAGLMPPAGRPRPDEATNDALNLVVNNKSNEPGYVEIDTSSRKISGTVAPGATRKLSLTSLSRKIRTVDLLRVIEGDDLSISARWPA